MTNIEQLKQYIGKAAFSCEADRYSVLKCVDDIERELLGRVPRWWRCDTHGEALPHNAWGCPECVREMRGKIARLLARLDSAHTVCRCAERVVNSNDYQGISDEDCDLDNAVQNWRKHTA